MAETRSGTENKLPLQLADLLCAEEAGSRPQNHARFLATESTLAHWQVLHEGDQLMHHRHRQSQFLHFLKLGPHFQILADETWEQISTAHSIHLSQTRTVSLDHLTPGSTRMPSTFSEVNGTSTQRPSECLDIQPHRHPRMTPRSSGTSTIETA